MQHASKTSASTTPQTSDEPGAYGFLTGQGQIVRLMEGMRRLAAAGFLAHGQCLRCGQELRALSTLWRCPTCYAIWPRAAESRSGPEPPAETLRVRIAFHAGTALLLEDAPV